MPGHTIRLLTADDVRRALPMAAAIAAMKRAFAALHAGRAIVPQRIHLDIEPHDGVTLVMPSFMDDDAGQALAVKVVSLFDGNRARGFARIQAAVLAFEPDTGRLSALLEGAALTAIRTGAVCGAATDFMARADSGTVAVLGAGVQARTLLEAVCTTRRIEQVRIFAPTAAHAEAMTAEVAGRAPIPRDVVVSSSSGQALRDADIICAATTSAAPVFDDGDLKPGAHINAVGSYQPHVREIAGATVCRALVVVDDREAALAETGDLIQPIEEGAYSADRIHAELGELVLGKKRGRERDDQITLFKSVGVAVQDAAAASVAVANATRDGIGQCVPWG